MKYLAIDAALSGTGIRDIYNGGYIDPIDLSLSDRLVEKIKNWLRNYEDEHYNGYKNEELIYQLDLEGKEIALMIKDELIDVKLEYFSDAKLTKEII